MNSLIGSLCLIWGFNWVVMKLGNDAFPPVFFAALRFLVGAAVLMIFAYARRSPLPNKRDFKWYALCGILQTTYFNIAIQIALNYISAGLTAVLTYSMPLFLSVMAHYMIPEDKLTMRQSIGIAIGMVGLFFAMGSHLGGDFWAMLLGLSSGVSWAFSNIIIKRKLQHCDNVQFTTWQMTVGAIGLLMYSLVFERGPYHFGVMPIIYVLFAGVIASALAFVMWFHILSKTAASKASISLLLVPIIGLVSGVLVLHERLKLVTLIGIVLVLIGIWFVNGRGKTRQGAEYPMDPSESQL